MNSLVDDDDETVPIPWFTAIMAAALKVFAFESVSCTIHNRGRYLLRNIGVQREGPRAHPAMKGRIPQLIPLHVPAVNIRNHIKVRRVSRLAVRPMAPLQGILKATRKTPTVDTEVRTTAASHRTSWRHGKCPLLSVMVSGRVLGSNTSVLYAASDPQFWAQWQESKQSEHRYHLSERSIRWSTRWRGQTLPDARLAFTCVTAAGRTLSPRRSEC